MRNGASDIMVKLEGMNAERDGLIAELQGELAEAIEDVDRIKAALERYGVDTGDTKPSATKQRATRGPRADSAASKVKAYVTSAACTTEFNAEHVSAQLTIERAAVSAELSRLAKKGDILKTDKRGEYRKVTQ